MRRGMVRGKELDATSEMVWSSIIMTGLHTGVCVQVVELARAAVRGRLCIHSTGVVGRDLEVARAVGSTFIRGHL